MSVEWGMVRVEAGTAGTCQIMKCFMCHAQKFILKAAKSISPEVIW